MDAREILRHIDEGANHFLLTLADGPHMTATDGGGFTVIRPKDGQEGVSFVCRLQLEGLSRAESAALITRAKATGLPVWFPLLATDAQFQLFFGRERIHSAAPAADDEVYLAMLPGEMAVLPSTHAVRWQDHGWCYKAEQYNCVHKPFVEYRLSNPPYRWSSRAQPKE